ncbi:MAG: ABC transporter [Burkholderiales bacterium RIFOXYC12_FULL_60_6]|nr:MAG: ABC transporter [Burkholderiales bacterium RIFOXYD12_FULL_59_19]OGB76454.1 MAG: ABC transporter [Burkholderiales bacterium RIFOXYC12_FULL_60_6]
MIHTHALTFQYPNGSKLTFPDVSLLPQGAVLLLSGPSGCGKSTWLALVAALMLPTSGEVTVAGQHLTTLKKIAADAWRAKAIGFLPQKLHLSAALTVAQNLALAQWASGTREDQAAITQALAALGVADLAQRLPSQLSGGQAQRAALARAVLLNPKVILADEPTASLDDDAAANAVTLLLTTAQAQGATLVIATHDARVAAALEPVLAPQNRLQMLTLPRRTDSDSSA